MRGVNLNKHFDFKIENTRFSYNIYFISMGVTSCEFLQKKP